MEKDILAEHFSPQEITNLVALIKTQVTAELLGTGSYAHLGNPYSSGLKMWVKNNLDFPDKEQKKRAIALATKLDAIPDPDKVIHQALLRKTRGE